MKRSYVLKTIILLFVALLAAAVMLAALCGNIFNDRRGGINFAEGETLDPYTVTLSCDGWTSFTYRNAPDFTELVFDGESAYYYELDCDRATQYSITATLTSPELDFYSREYELGIKYFTRQKERIANILAVYVSEDGVNFTETDRTDCYDSGALTDAWRQTTLTLGAGAKYIRFGITVFYSGAGAEKVDNAGLYIAKEFTLSAVPGANVSPDLFTELEVEETELYYNGEAQYPSYTVHNSEEGKDEDDRQPIPAHYTKCVAKQGGDVVQPVNAGEYTLCVGIYDDANKLITEFEKPYTIKKQTLELVSYEFVSNAKHAFLWRAAFKDGADRDISIEEANVKRMYDNAYAITLTVNNPNFESYSIGLGTLKYNFGATYMFFVEDTDPVYTYDGTVKGVNPVVFSTYNVETNAHNFISASIPTVYYQNNEPVDEPKDVGEYEYAITYGNKICRGTMRITPAEITTATYEGEANLDKTYDGTTSVAADGKIIRTLPIKPVGVKGEDEVYLTAERVQYARDVGRTYVNAVGVTIGGADAGNYVCSDVIYVTGTEGVISPVGLYWANMSDENGGSVKIEEREYDGTSSASILNQRDYVNDNGDIVKSQAKVGLDMKGIGSGRVTYGDISCVFDKADAGDRKPIFTLKNEQLYDRYLPSITVNDNFSAKILKKSLDAVATSYSGADKTYDGTDATSLSIEGISVDEVFDYGDGFNAILATNGYAVDYERAYYDDIHSGNHPICVEGVRLIGFTADDQSVLDNYSVNEMSVVGSIDPGEVYVITEKLRIYTREALPEIKTTSDDPEVIGTTVYASVADAEAMTNALPSTTSITVTGLYYVRVDSLSIDFAIAGNNIIPLEITEANSRQEQHIEIRAFNIAEAVPVAVGGVFSMNGVSVSADGYKTGLGVEYTVSGANVEVLGGGEFRVRSAGNFSITASCMQSANYKQAQDVTVNFLAKAIDAKVAGTIDLTTGTAVPTFNEGEIGITVGGASTQGTLVPTTDDMVGSGKRTYAYNFTQKGVFAEKDVLSVQGTVYEKAANEYFVSGDEHYIDGKTYYNVDAVEFVYNGEFVGCYEKTANGYKLTDDMEYDEEKTYYKLTVSQNDARQVKIHGYYLFDGTDYVEVPVGGLFTEEETYYIVEKDFFGSVPMNVEINGQKMDITVVLRDMQIAYGEKVNPMKAIHSVNVYGMPLPVSEVYDMGITVDLVKINAEGREVVTNNILDVGSYTIGGTNEERYEFSVPDIYDFAVVFEGEVALNVTRSRITVCAGNMLQSYRAGLEQAELLSAVVIRGSYVAADKDEILAAVQISSTSSPLAQVGDYAICISGETETENYIISYRAAYVTVIPAQVMISASSAGHVYGNDPSEIVVSITITNPEKYDSENAAALKEEILPYITANANVDSATDVGNHVINLSCEGTPVNFTPDFASSYYTITPADLTGISLDDVNVLYNGERHSIKITYDESVWQDLTVRYNNGYFVNPGIYEYTAVVSKRNYNSITLSAVLTIGTLTAASSSFGANSVNITLKESDCPKGLSPEVGSILLAKNSEGLKAAKDKVAATNKELKFDVIAAYDVSFTYNGENVNYSFSTYEVEFRPSNLEYSSDLKLYAYGKDGYEEIEYEYENGVYKVNVTSLNDLVFIREKEEKPSTLFVIIGVVIFAFIVLIVLSVVFTSGKRGKKERMRSRKRHHRWA